MNRLSFYQPTLVAAAAAAFCAGAVQAQPQLVADATTTAGGSQQVVVTGVRGGQERTVADSPVPIDVISGEDLKLTGRADLKQALATLLPSFNYGTNLSGGDAYVRPLTNRGLGGAYTLVLVNGKRWHRSAMLAAAAGDASGANPVDIDFIPFSAIDHVEVLKDSAAAQYGSDAVAGVINIILKHANHGGDIGISGGKLYAGDGGNGKLLGDVGLKLPQDGFLDLSVELKHEGSAVYNAGPSTATPYFPLPNGSPDPRDATWNKVGEKNGDPKIDLVTTGANLELPLSAALKAYAFGTVAQRKTTLGNNVRLPSGSADIPEIFPDPYYPSATTRTPTRRSCSAPRAAPTAGAGTSAIPSVATATTWRVR